MCVCPGLCDTVCEQLCGHTCTWYSLPAGVHIITVSNLSPGSEYQLKVYSTSQEQMGPPYYTHPIRTSELSLHIHNIFELLQTLRHWPKNLGSYLL